MQTRAKCFKHLQSLLPSLSHAFGETLTSTPALIYLIHCIPHEWGFWPNAVVDFYSPPTQQMCATILSPPVKCYLRSECMNTLELTCTHATRCPLSCTAGCLPLRGVGVGNLRWRTPGNAPSKTSVGQQACYLHKLRNQSILKLFLCKASALFYVQYKSPGELT